jgi:plasmid stability protein
MASITIRRLDERTKARLRVRAARNNHSMEQEARDILRQALSRPSVKPQKNWVEAIRARFAALGYVDIPEFPDQPIRDPEIFDK